MFGLKAFPTWLEVLGALVTPCALVTSCASVSIDRAWKDPTIPEGAYNSLMVYCSCPDTIAARILEDDITRGLADRGVEAQPAYRIVGSAELSEPELHERLSGRGIDGIVLVRMTGVESREAYVPGVRYAEPETYWFYDRWVTVFHDVHEPGYFDRYQVLNMQADLYDEGTGRLMTSLSTSQVKSDDVNVDMQDFARLLVGELERMRLLQRNDLHA